MDVKNGLTCRKTVSSHCTDSPYASGLGLRQALLRAPTLWGSAARRQHALMLTAYLGLGDGKEASKRHRDLFPLPLLMSAEDVAWVHKAGDFLSLHCQQPDELLPLGQRAWGHGRGMGLNSLYKAPQTLDNRVYEKGIKDLQGRGALAVEEEAPRLTLAQILPGRPLEGRGASVDGSGALAEEDLTDS